MAGTRRHLSPLHRADSDYLLLAASDAQSAYDPNTAAELDAEQADKELARRAGGDTATLIDAERLLRSGSPDPVQYNANNRSSVMGAALNFTNSIIGAGVIGLPYAFRQAGFFGGIILLLLLTWLVDWTVVLLVQDGKLASRTTYQELIYFCFGKYGRAAITFFQFIFAFGGDTLPVVLHSVFPILKQPPYLMLTSRAAMISLTTIGISLPLSMYRDLSALSKTSAISMLSLVIIVLSIVVRAPMLPKSLKGDQSLRLTLFGEGFFQAIGVISFAFVCHHNTFTIYGSLKVPTIDRFTTVTHMSTITSFVTSLILAWCGYWTFTDKTSGNILNNFDKDDMIINIARFCFAVNMFTTFPMECFVAREVLDQFFYSESDIHPTPLLRHVLWTVLLVLTSLGIALSTCDLGVVLELTGGFSATVIAYQAYILPPLCYIQLTSGRIWGRKKLPHVLCIIFGTSVMTMTTINTLSQYSHRSGPAKVC